MQPSAIMKNDLEVENMNNIVQMRMFAFCGLLSILNYIWCTDLKDI